MPRRTVPLNRSSASIPTSPALELERPMSRGFKCINVHPVDKVAFDELQSFWSFEHSRPLSQWDTFTLLVTRAYEPDLVTMPPSRKVA